MYSTCDTYILMHIYICASCKRTLSCDAIVCMFRVEFAVREKMIEFEPLNLSETSKEPHNNVYMYSTYITTVECRMELLLERDSLDFSLLPDCHSVSHSVSLSWPTSSSVGLSRSPQLLS